MQDRPLRTLGFLALVSVTGIVGQLVAPERWSAPFLAAMLAPLAAAALLRLFRRGVGHRTDDRA